MGTSPVNSVGGRLRWAVKVSPGNIAGSHPVSTRKAGSGPSDAAPFVGTGYGCPRCKVVLGTKRARQILANGDPMEVYRGYMGGVFETFKHATRNVKPIAVVTLPAIGFHYAILELGSSMTTVVPSTGVAVDTLGQAWIRVDAPQDYYAVFNTRGDVVAKIDWDDILGGFH